MLVEFHGLRFDLPPDWTDITDALPQGSPPSLARPHGAGALQFTFAEFISGEEPNVTMNDLQKFLIGFFSEEKRPHTDVIQYPGKTFSIEGKSRINNDFIIARYFSNGNDVTLVTYVCSNDNSEEFVDDLEGVEIIMNSIDFQ